MSTPKLRVAVLHGVNFDVLERRGAVYGGLSLSELEEAIEGFAQARSATCTFFQTNHEGAYVEALHRLSVKSVDAVIVNPGAWTHYSWAIHDALELVNVPIAEVHLTDLSEREPFRARSVISDVVAFTVTGRGIDGYADALTQLAGLVADGPVSSVVSSIVWPQ